MSDHENLNPPPDASLFPALENPVQDFLYGARLPFRGIRFLAARPKLWWLVAVPLTLNMLLFGFLLFWGGGFFADCLRERLGTWEEARWYLKAVLVLARILFWLIVLILVYFVFTPAALLIAAPFNDRLAEHTERAAGFRLEDNRSLVVLIASEAVFAIASEVKRLAVFGGGFLVLLPLNLIPGLGSMAYAVAAFLWAAFGCAFEFIGYAADRRHCGLRRKWGLLGTRKPLVFGYGMMTAMLFMVPFLNVFIVPVSAVSGSFLFCLLMGEEEKTSR
ncbi:EI24 domain-containing protein [bacterium]|nr:EI24 domain-containing protein [bacterium]